MLLPEAKKVNKELLKELDIPEREKERVSALSVTNQWGESEVDEFARRLPT
ncbi:unnamed protein product [marine sediment metagenome]|uniref:Uncharacterized protein n=1 Tax=marine sediment metagenome TaxID=412755 RepID=X1IYR3_9ZZZZ